MATYDFKCIKCANAFDIVVSIKAVVDAGGILNVHCPICGSKRVRRIYNNVNVIFVGDGFYKNDNKNTP